MKVRSTAIELANEVEKDLAFVMLEKRHSGRIRSEDARALMETIKNALNAGLPKPPLELPEHDLLEGFPVH